jgi:hypothetical protein
MFITLKNEDEAMLLPFNELLGQLGCDKAALHLCVNYIENQLNLGKDEEEVQVLSTKTSSSTSVSSAYKEKENLRKPLLKRKVSHNKYNKLQARKPAALSHLKNLQSNIPHFYKLKKKKLSVRHKSI